MISEWGEGYDWSAAEPEAHVDGLDGEVEVDDRWKRKARN